MQRYIQNISQTTAHLFYSMLDLPYSPEKGGENRACWDIFRFPLGPVVGSEGSGECTLPQRDGEINQPEEDEQIAQLQEEDVVVIHALTAIECEETLSSWTLLSDVGPVERLSVNTTDRNRGDSWAIMYRDL